MVVQALAGAEIRLMDINPERLSESEIIVGKLAQSLGGKATIKTYSNQRRALEGANFVVCCFQVGGYEPCTVTDFEVPKQYGLRQTIADTLGVGGIMRGLRTVPVLWGICEDILQVCPNALMMQYVNPMAINTWAIAAKYPAIKQVGLCHSVQGTAAELARVCRPGGTVAITVPAFQSLWSQHDEINHHFRRYLSPEVGLLFAGKLRLDYATYFNSLLFFPIWVYRMLSRWLPKPPGSGSDFQAINPKSLINRLFFALFSLELMCLRFFRFPVGVSLLHLYSK
jgi:hypothetical protein